MTLLPTGCRTVKDILLKIDSEMIYVDMVFHTTNIVLEEAWLFHLLVGRAVRIRFAYQTCLHRDPAGQMNMRGPATNSHAATLRPLA